LHGTGQSFWALCDVHREGISLWARGTAGSKFRETPPNTPELTRTPEHRKRLC